MNRLGIYQTIVNGMEETYKAKNSDYGNSVGDTFEKFGSIFVKIHSFCSQYFVLFIR